MRLRTPAFKLFFEFVGGPHDGKILHGVVGTASDAERYFLLSSWGKVGQRFRVGSEFAVDTLAEEKLKNERQHNFQGHVYVVADRFEDDVEVCVRAKYDPQATTSGRKVSQ